LEKFGKNINYNFRVMNERFKKCSVEKSNRKKGGGKMNEEEKKEEEIKKEEEEKKRKEEEEKKRRDEEEMRRKRERAEKNLDDFLSARTWADVEREYFGEFEKEFFKEDEMTLQWVDGACVRIVMYSENFEAKREFSVWKNKITDEKEGYNVWEKGKMNPLRRYFSEDELYEFLKQLLLRKPCGYKLKVFLKPDMPERFFELEKMY